MICEMMEDLSAFWKALEIMLFFTVVFIVLIKKTEVKAKRIQERTLYCFQIQEL